MKKQSFHLYVCIYIYIKVSYCSSCCGGTFPGLGKAEGTQSQLKLVRVETKNATDLGCFVLLGTKIQAQYLVNPSD